MLFTTQTARSLMVAAALAATPLFVGEVQAGCKCGGGGQAGGSASVSYVDAGQYAGGMVTEGYVTEGAPLMAPYGAPLGMATAYAGMASGAYSPPPGTLGRTYQLRSYPIPTDKHPRSGMLGIRVAGATKIIVHDTNEFRTEDKLDGFRDANDPTLYHFTSEPLWPGIPHVYRVEVHIAGENGISVQERYVRLIMGRVVFLNI